MFQNVDATKNYSIQDIVPVKGFEGYGREQIQVLDKDGNVSETYKYYCADVYDKAGWYLKGVYATKELQQGESILLKNDNDEGCSVQFAGQVSYIATTISAAQGGFIIAGNATPVDINIQEFVPCNGFQGYGKEQIQIVDSDGNICETYKYYNADVYEVAGWYRNGVYADRVIKAGEGFLVKNDNGPFSLTIPAVK